MKDSSASARLGAGLTLVPMTMDEVDEVHAMECSVFPHPWSRANFSDSIQAGYDAWLLRAPAQVAKEWLAEHGLE